MFGLFAVLDRPGTNGGMVTMKNPKRSSFSKRRVTVTESVFVRRRPEDVWDFTQDYSRRHEWDSSVFEATVLDSYPVPRVRVRCSGRLKSVFQYRQFDRPSRTSLTMEEVQSTMLAGGGGSWSYVEMDGGTVWTQTNTLVMKAGWWRRLLVPLVQRQLLLSTRQAMQRAKQMLENDE